MGQICSAPNADKDDLEHKQAGRYMLHKLYDDDPVQKKKPKSAGSDLRALSPRTKQTLAPQRAPERGPHMMAFSSGREEPVPPQAPRTPMMQVEATSTASSSHSRPQSSAASASASRPPQQQQQPAPNASWGNDDYAMKQDRNQRANDTSLNEPASPTLLPDLSSGAGGQEWKAAEFSKLLSDARHRSDDAMTKRLLKQVAEHNYVLRHEWRIPRTMSVSSQRCNTNRVRGKGRDPEVTFSLLDTGDAIKRLASDRKRRICALNFANGEHVGGGYKSGATAQEEDLCRRIPSLYTSLNNAKRDGLYPFGPCTCSDKSQPAKYSDVLYTKGLVLARSSEAEGFALLRPDEQAMFSLVTAAAPNINFAKEVHDLDLMYQTVKTIFVAPVLEEPQINTLILGAWGCGAFGCDPVQISDLFTRAIKEGLGRLYKEVVFAIPEGRNADVFRSALERSKIEVKTRV